MRPRPFLVILVTLGCSPAMQVSRLSPDRYPAKPADTPIRLYSTQRPTCAFEELATVRAHQRNRFISRDEVVESIRAKARELGGDAAIDFTEGNEVRGGTIVGNSVAVDNDPVIAAVVIRFKDGKCQD